MPPMVSPPVLSARTVAVVVCWGISFGGPSSADGRTGPAAFRRRHFESSQYNIINTSSYCTSAECFSAYDWHSDEIIIIVIIRTDDDQPSVAPSVVVMIMLTNPTTTAVAPSSVTHNHKRHLLLSSPSDIHRNTLSTSALVSNFFFYKLFLYPCDTSSILLL